MRKIIVLLIIFFLQWNYSTAQVYSNSEIAVSIDVDGNAPESATLNIDGGPHKGLLIPRLSGGNISNISSPDEGLIVYNIDSGCLNIFVSGIWKENCAVDFVSDSKDSESGEWTVLPKLPEGSNNAIAFSIDSMIYFGTGQSGSAASHKMWAYNTANNTWTVKNDFPGGLRYSAVGFSISGKGYIALGYNGSTYYSDIWEYNQVSDSWQQMTNFPGVARQEAVVFVIDNKAYVGTGRNGNTFYKDFYVFDPSVGVGGTWIAIKDFEGDAIFKATAFTNRGLGHVLGGANNNANRELWAYDPETDDWIFRMDLTGTAIGLWDATAFTIGNTSYITSGDVVFDWNLLTWQYDSNSPTTLTQVANIPRRGRIESSVAVVEDRAFVLSGIDSNNVSPPLRDVLEFSIPKKYIQSFDSDDKVKWINIKDYTEAPNDALFNVYADNLETISPTTHQISFDQVLLDPSASFSNSQFTIPEDGAYSFDAHICFDNGDPNGAFDEIVLAIQVDNVNTNLKTRIDPKKLTSPGYEYSVSLSGILDLSTGQDVRVYIQGINQNNVRVNRRIFNGYKIK